jgi:hypothetical protein
MKFNSNVCVSNRQQFLSGCPRFVNFTLSLALVWGVLLLAPQGFAATGAVKNSSVVVCTLDAVDIGADSGGKSSEVKPQAFLSSLSRCCEQSTDHKQMPESCQTPCPASGCTLSAIWVWQLPAHALLTMKFAPRVIGAPNSLLHQRLNRPPITGRSA